MISFQMKQKVEIRITTNLNTQCGRICKKRTSTENSFKSNHKFRLYHFYTFYICCVTSFGFGNVLIPCAWDQSAVGLVKVSLEKLASNKLSIAKKNHITASTFFFSKRFVFLYLLTMFNFLPGCLVGK